jgi:hypothetical protein
VGSAPGAAGTPAPGQTLFLDLQTASSVSSSDGCAEVPQNQFPADIQEIYVTARALNIRAGTRLDVEWRYEGQVVWQENWTVPTDSVNFCLWFNLDPSVAQLVSGNWSASLYADGTIIGAPAPFFIGGDAMDDMG